MFKIQNVFERDENGTLLPFYTYPGLLLNCADRYVSATEKLDGTNVRLTIRNHTVVRIEKRRHPNKEQKSVGIIEPWYIDVSVTNPNDKHIIEAVAQTDISRWHDGEYFCEAIGPKIQNNPLGLSTPRCVRLFTDDIPVYEYRNGAHTGIIPTSYEGLRAYLQDLESLYAPGHLAEGIVFYLIKTESNANDMAPHTYYAKIRRRDFDYG